MEQQQQLNNGTLESMRVLEEARNKKIQLLKARLVDSPPTIMATKENKTKKRKKVTFEDEKEPKRTKKTSLLTPTPQTPSDTQFQLTPVQEVEPHPTEGFGEEDYDSLDEIDETVPATREESQLLLRQPEFKTALDNLTKKPNYPREALAGPTPTVRYRPRQLHYVTTLKENKINPLIGRTVAIIPNKDARFQTTMVDTTTQNPWKAGRDAKKQRTLEEPPIPPMDQGPSFFSKAIDTIKPHASNLGSRVASQFALLVLGAGLVFAKGHLQRMASNHDQTIGRQAPPPYIQNPMPPQPTPPQNHNYSAPPNHHDAALSERMFGPAWK